MKGSQLISRYEKDRIKIFKKSFIAIVAVFIVVILASFLVYGLFTGRTSSEYITQKSHDRAYYEAEIKRAQYQLEYDNITQDAIEYYNAIIAKAQYYLDTNTTEADYIDLEKAILNNYGDKGIGIVIALAHYSFWAMAIYSFFWD